ncbi:hypothetical protein TWF718_009267 [Orbilia javanica]|uniref:Uncharacterized protein n=1 Tax=Orbilia javanica TaxID=47235 RepID=A0AAN8RMD5_9PEZI
MEPTPQSSAKRAASSPTMTPSKRVQCDSLSSDIVEIAPGGDLHTTLEEYDEGSVLYKRTFLTSSHAMALASPLLRFYIDGSGAQDPLPKITQNPSTGKTDFPKLTLVSPMIGAGEMVLKIIHHKPNDFLECYSVDALRAVADFCYSYGLEKSVYPVIKSWINVQWSRDARDTCITLRYANGSRQQTTQGEKVFSDEPHPHPHPSSVCEKWLWIARVFQVELILAECGQNVIFNCPKISKRSIQAAHSQLDPLERTIHRSMIQHSEVILKSWKKIKNAIMADFKKIYDGCRDISAKGGVICNRVGGGAQPKCDIWQMGTIFQVKAKLDLADGMTLAEVCKFLKAIGAQRGESHCCRSSRALVDRLRLIAREAEEVDLTSVLMDSFREIPLVDLLSLQVESRGE